MRPDEQQQRDESEQVTNLPAPKATDASPIADRVKGGATTTTTTTTSNMTKTFNDANSSTIGNLK
jgi:hypothetical protein